MDPAVKRLLLPFFGYIRYKKPYQSEIAKIKNGLATLKKRGVVVPVNKEAKVGDQVVVVQTGINPTGIVK